MEKKNASSHHRRPKKSSKHDCAPVTLAECAEALNLGRRRINQLVKEGLPKVSHGRYDLKVCFKWYIRYLQRKIVERANLEGYNEENGDGGGPATSSTATRHKLLSIQMQLKQLELAEKREQVITTVRVQKDVTALVHEVKTRILALSPSLAAALLGETDLAIAQVIIDRALKGTLESLSHFNPEGDAVKPF